MTTRPETQVEAQAEVDVLDCSGLLCPLPVYKAALALERIQTGDRLQLITTDPGALEDIPAMSRQRGDILVSVDRREDRQIFLIEKGPVT
jgi:tRNA 2-thiouridine synthesizing protein A